MLEFRNVSKAYEGHGHAVEDVSLTIREGELVVFIGTSGSGKTTCLRMINRMTEPTSGQILLHGQDVAEMDPVQLRRRIGYVIQQVGLMPHMTIRENAALVPTLLGWDEARKGEIVRRLMRQTDLDEALLDRYPAELSGGQRQRVGVIRTLTADPEIILMDEPFGALDPITRDQLQALIKRLHKELGKTIVFVTHDMDEALTLADRIVIMEAGRVVQFDTPEAILQDPANELVEGLLGEERLNEARLARRTVDEIMDRGFDALTADASLREALKIMRKKRAETLFVTDGDGAIQGVVDIFALESVNRRQAKRAKAGQEGPDLMGAAVSTVMEPASYIASETLIRDAVHWIVDLGYRYLPVVDERSRLIGIVTRASLVEDLYSDVWGSPEDDVAPVQTTEDMTGPGVPGGGGER
ncbi:MAG: ABC transporter ATP-binding protein [Synergistaceae bacterium]|nr:ABC transporter ATP-binding protein [Synergistaceae bacterium]